MYGGSILLDLNGSNLAPSPQAISGMIIKKNSLFSRDANSVIFRQVDYTNAFNAGTIDSNFYFQPYNINRYALRMISNTPTYYNFANWQLTGNDPNTQSSFVNWTSPVDSSQLFMNQTDNIVIIPLGNFQYLDLAGNPICSNLTLQPYTSQILIQTNISCTTGIEENNSSLVLSFYPNPTTDFITILKPETNKNLNYQILDNTGRTVLEGTLTDANTNLSLESLANGIYFLHTFGEIEMTLKIIKN